MSTLPIVQCPSPNCGARRDGLLPSLIVIHYTAMESCQAALERLCDPDAEVSAHYLISNAGVITQMVPESERAWHAGPGEWAGFDDINSRSIGVELDNRGNHPFSEPQMHALEGLLQGIMTRWAIPAAGVIGHSDMAPDRKYDPGRHFDWARLARLGLAGAGMPHQTDMVVVNQEAFTVAASALGYTTDVAFQALLAATRLRFAPWRQGPLTADDLSLMHRFAR